MVLGTCVWLLDNSVTGASRREGSRISRYLIHLSRALVNHNHRGFDTSLQGHLTVVDLLFESIAQKPLDLSLGRKRGAPCLLSPVPCGKGAGAFRPYAVSFAGGLAREPSSATLEKVFTPAEPLAARLPASNHRPPGTEPKKHSQVGALAGFLTKTGPAFEFHRKRPGFSCGVYDGTSLWLRIIRSEKGGNEPPTSNPFGLGSKLRLATNQTPSTVQ